MLIDQLLCLPEPVDSRKRFFVQQTVQPVFTGDLFHRLHHQLILVGSDVGDGEDGRQFMLAGRDLVVTGLGEDAEFPQFLIEILHKCDHARLDGPEVMILQLLPLRRLCPKEGAAGKDEVLARVVHLAVDEKILLLRADGGIHALDGHIAEQAQDAQGLAVEGAHAL